MRKVLLSNWAYLLACGGVLTAVGCLENQQIQGLVTSTVETFISNAIRTFIENAVQTGMGL